MDVRFRTEQRDEAPIYQQQVKRVAAAGPPSSAQAADHDVDRQGPKPTMPKILIADDHELVRDVVAAVLSAQDIGQLHKAACYNEALDLIGRNGPFDLVVLDYNMPSMPEPEELGAIRTANASRPVALMSGVASPEIAAAALRSGAAGFIPKTLNPQAIISAIRLMLAGEIFFPYTFMTKTKVHGPRTDLTSRELAVLSTLR